MRECRAMVTSGARYERLLLTDAAFSLILNHRGLADAAVIEPDLLVATAREARALAARRLIAPPRVLAVTGEGEAGGFCDESVGQDCTDEEFLRAARRAAAAVMPALARPMEAARRGAVGRLLDRLGMPPSLSGRAYLLLAGDMLTASPMLRERLTDGVYPAVAARFHVSRYAVERAMRTAIEHVWLRGSMDEIAVLFGMTVDPDRGKPTNGEFLSLLAEHARNQLSLAYSKYRAEPSPVVSAMISATASRSARMPR